MKAAGAVLAVLLAAQSPARVAVLDLAGDEGGEFAAPLRAAAAGAAALVDAGQARAAARGVGYSGGLNLSREEARALGMSVGCDFYVLGRAQVTRRLGAHDETYYDALAGLFVVETRRGRLIRFACPRARAAGEAEARAQLTALIKDEWPEAAAAIEAAGRELSAPPELTARAPEEVYDLREAGAGPPGVRPPVFYQRLKPDYTEEARLAGVAAIVELEAVFGADGRVGEVEVTRWAGFGLDEASVATARQLRFKPAERDGRPVSVRALVRYQFRQPL